MNQNLALLLIAFAVLGVVVADGDISRPDLPPAESSSNSQRATGSLPSAGLAKDEDSPPGFMSRFRASLLRHLFGRDKDVIDAPETSTGEDLTLVDPITDADSSDEDIVALEAPEIASVEPPPKLPPARAASPGGNDRPSPKSSSPETDDASAPSSVVIVLNMKNPGTLGKKLSKMLDNINQARNQPSDVPPEGDDGSTIRDASSSANSLAASASSVSSSPGAPISIANVDASTDSSGSSAASRRARADEPRRERPTLGNIGSSGPGSAPTQLTLRAQPSPPSASGQALPPTVEVEMTFDNADSGAAVIRTLLEGMQR
jgi:hypothetical protein